MASEQKTKFKQTEIGKIPEDWEIKKTNEILLSEKGAIKIGPFGSQLKKEFLVNDGFKLYGQENIFKNNFEIGDRYIDKERFELLKSCELKPGDLIISMMGTIGFVQIVPKEIRKGIMDSHLLRLRIDKKKMNKKFILYAVRSKIIQNQIDSLSVGTIMSGLSSKVIKMLLFPCPPIEEQNTIAKILSDNDSKIELNQKMNTTLETSGQVLFKHWFIDFEFPNENGEPYKSSGGEMVYNDELEKKIPKGWETIKLKDKSDLMMGVSPKSTSYNEKGEGYPLLNGAADFEGDIIKPKKFTTNPIRICKKGDLIFCIRATIGNLVVSDKEYCLGRGVSSITLKNIVNKEFIYYHLKHSFSILISRATGSVILGLTKADIENYTIAFPPEGLMTLFHKITEPIFNKKSKLSQENKILSELRNALLPKLMSGKIRVSASGNNGE